MLPPFKSDSPNFFLTLAVLAILSVFAPQAVLAKPPECSSSYAAGKLYCVSPERSPWVWTASPTYGSWRAGPFTSESSATSAGMAKVTEVMTAPPTAVCSVSYASTNHDAYPVTYEAGEDVRHTHVVNINWVIDKDGTPPCAGGAGGTGFYLDQQRKIYCPTRPDGEPQFSLYYAGTPAKAFCGLEWERPHKTPCDKCQKNLGNPTEVFTGTKTESKTDYSSSGISPLRLQRNYRSDVAHANNLYTAAGGQPDDYRQPFGAGWSAPYFQRIDVSTSGDFTTAYAYRPDGLLITFNLEGTDFLADDDESSRLVKLLDGSGNHIGWKLTDIRDTAEVYDAAGRLLSIEDRTGRTQTLTYASAGDIFPSSVTDDFGHTLAFNYDTHVPYPRVSAVTLPDSTQILYGYDSRGNLSTVTYADSSVLTYLYELHPSGGQYQNYLTGITTENSVRYSTYTYGGPMIIATEHAGGVDRFEFEFAHLIDGGTHVLDPLGQWRWYGNSVVSGTRRFSLSTAPCAGCTDPKTSAYDTDGNEISRRDFNNNLTCFAYGTSRNLETVRIEGFAPSVSSCPSSLATYTPASGTRERKITTSWHSTFRIPASIAEDNRTTSFTHDSNGNVLTRTVTDTSVTPNVSRTWTYTYNSYGQVLTEDSPRTDVSDVTTYAYYSCTTGYQCGQLHTVTNALGHVTTYNNYNANGQPTQVTDPNGLVTTMGYDARQRMTNRCVGGTLPSCSGGELTHLDYWPTGLLKKVTSPDASYIQYTYDAAHRLTQVNDGAGNKVVYTLDNMGNRTAENTYDPSNALRRTHSRVFNNLNQLWKDVNAAGTAAVTTTFGYDTQGNQNSVAAPLSRNSASVYDELNRLQQITDPASGVTQFAYDANDNLASVTDPRSLVTSYAYTGFGDLKTQVSPDTGTTSNTYDSGGNLDTSTDARGAVTDYAYDAANRVTSAAFSLGGTPDPTITYTYDAGTYGKGRLTGASDSNHALAWTYDAHGRVTGKSQTVGSVVLAEGYAYNASGQLATITLPSGNSVGFGYNSNNQVTSVTLNGSTTILSGVTYDPFGPITGWTWGNSTTASRAFDTDGKLTQLDNANGTSLKNLEYDDAFRITGITDVGNSAYSWSYGYDNLDRLTSATGSSITRGWSYDANGNRLTEAGSAPSSFTYTTSPGSNRLASITGSLPRTYGYDAAGNTLSYASATFGYNARGRMSSAANSGTTASYLYNALGQRVKRTVSGTATLYAYDEAGHLQGEYTSTGAPIQETVWLGDIPIATIRPNGSSGVDLFYVHADQLNTPRLVTDTANNLRWIWESDPFGTNVPDENPSSMGLLKYNLRFPGQLFDGILGLHYNYFRDYDPAVGRYVESDPIGLKGGMNTFGYVKANAVNLIDPKGLEGVGPWTFPPGPQRDRLAQSSGGSCGGGCCAKVKMWICDRPIMRSYGWLLPNHMYACCDGPNLNCFGHANNDLKAGDPIPREGSPNGSCREIEVCAELKERKCNNPTSPRDAGTFLWNCRDWAKWDGK